MSGKLKRILLGIVLLLSLATALTLALVACNDDITTVETLLFEKARDPELEVVISTIFEIGKVRRLRFIHDRRHNHFYFDWCTNVWNGTKHPHPGNCSFKIYYHAYTPNGHIGVWNGRIRIR